mmetsp:Transcript_42518/g.96769  ORF Transcript_42518/g.96769 Transcript_42518/m.96769 type:complete len:251 (-) Transcript_42518:199-951(-)|eukprot:CAMPEP_0180410930 /NCGR_PEP_ID=MMETSP0989-20121125/43692_1 /TAXON_ID=697907 /ORGANISM="non described non described, Strain CCMP2293" /LENGTH=250 /DNA_ID=CAMNT_0022415207 /DNA_START=66 /DNA_END=818 /DNA_ORIENTATION=-
MAATQVDAGFQTLKVIKALADHGEIESGVPEWRKALVKAVHAVSLELFFLLLLDVACVCAEIVIGIHVLHEEVKHAEALLEACEAGGLAHRRVSEVHADARPSWHGWEEAERIIHIISIAILSLFALELLLLMIGLGATFFRNNEGAGLFILLRIWRLVRILHGVLEASTLTPDHSPGVLKTREPGARQLREKMKGAREAIARAQTLPHEEAGFELRHALLLLQEEEGDAHGDELHVGSGEREGYGVGRA